MAPEPTAQEREQLEDSLKNLKLSGEELNKFEKAFKDPEFLKLFADYAREVSDPKAKAETDAYLRQLEEQGRAEEVYGKGVQLLSPEEAFVLKTKATSKGPDVPSGQKVFVNMCTCSKLDKYSLEDAKDPATGRTGKRLQLPLSLGPKRMGTDKEGKPAAVFDFVVHPETIVFAMGNVAAFQALAETALEHVEKQLSCKLSRQFKRLNVKYKGTEGCPKPPVQSYRTGEGGESVNGKLRPRADAPAADVPGARTMEQQQQQQVGGGGEAAGAGGAGAEQEAGANGGAGKAAARSTFSFDKAGGKKKEAAAPAPAPTDPAQAGYRHPDGAVTPEWTLVHRGEADLAAAWGDAGRGLALGTTVPKELLLRATLPGVPSAGTVDLDVGERSLALKVPGRFQLVVPLPHAVDHGKGKAKFDKARQVLEITLPVVPPPPPASLARLQQLQQEQQQRQGQGQGAVGAQAREQEEDVEQEEGSGVEASASSGEEAGAVAGERGVAAGVEPAGAADEVGAHEACVASSAEGGHAGDAGVETENQRLWRELHEQQQRAAQQAAGGGEREGQEQAGPMAGGAVHEGGACAAAGAAGSGAGAQVGAVSAAAPAPTVVLRPRLNRDLAMELD